MHTSCGDITLALDAKHAPKTVNSFVFLAQNDFYNGRTFHRIVTDFVDPGREPDNDTGTVAPATPLPDEPPKPTATRSVTSRWRTAARAPRARSSSSS